MAEGIRISHHLQFVSSNVSKNYIKNAPEWLKKALTCHSPISSFLDSLQPGQELCVTLSIETKPKRTKESNISL